ncbi:hypothetical protein Catovirus_1_115 [Catovirus CTV1]|uniref:Uncharacterized protein n=1 Tax=Catovirus CTV1 TaxID=1977631 RepID=A0A1V0S8N3_9VIRU|nr:hypothetical protein Catovirus_1_115 [Catovirus CTV1]
MKEKYQVQLEKLFGIYISEMRKALLIVILDVASLLHKIILSVDTS